MSRKPIIVDGVDVYECEHLREEFTECYLNDPDIDYINYCCAYTNECKKYSDCYYKQLKRKEQECEMLKNITTLQSKDMHNKKQQLNQLKEENEILEKDKANLDVIIETLKAQFKRLEKENVELKELVKTRIEDLCDSCGASSMMPMPCKVYEQALQEIKEICNSVWGNGLDEEVDKFDTILQKCEVLKDE